MQLFYVKNVILFLLSVHVIVSFLCYASSLVVGYLFLSSFYIFQYYLLLINIHQIADVLYINPNLSLIYIYFYLLCSKHLTLSAWSFGLRLGHLGSYANDDST